MAYALLILWRHACAGLCLGVSIVRGALIKHQVREMAYWDPSQEKWVVVGNQFRPLLEWTLKTYSTGVSGDPIQPSPLILSSGEAACSCQRHAWAAPVHNVVRCPASTSLWPSVVGPCSWVLVGCLPWDLPHGYVHSFSEPAVSCAWASPQLVHANGAS